MPRVAVLTRQYPKATTLNAGPFLGCRDATDPTTASPQLCRAMQNVYRANGPAGSPLVGRPGFAQMGSAGGTVVQAGAITWTTFAGVALTIRVVDGAIQTYDFVAGSWSVALSSAALTGASKPLSTTARVSLVPFADKLIISDGVNKMLWWDGVNLAGVTKLTNAPVAYGVPSVYASKLVVIDAATQRTMFWSEEGDATIGYDATVGPITYVNAWDNVGGYTEPMTRVFGTNEALYIMRARKALAVTGAMGSDFATSHTKANISPYFGTVSPWACLETTQGILMLDADGLPRLFHYGNPEPLDLSTECFEAVKRTPRAALVNALCATDVSTGSLLLGIPGPTQTWPDRWLVFADTDLQYQGTWVWGRTASSAGVVTDNHGVNHWTHSDRVGGKMSLHGTPVDGPWVDTVAGLTQSIAHTGWGPFLGFDPRREMTIDRIEMGFTEPSTRMEICYETSRGLGTWQAVTVGASGGGFILGVNLLGDPLGSSSIGGHAEVGTAGRGRWVSLGFRHSVGNERFGHDVQRVTAAFTLGNAQSP